jgi:hypothetical protein
MKTKATKNEVLQAIENVNKKYGYQIMLNNAEQKGNYFHFTIRSRFSGIAGSRFSHSGRKLVSASWHAHGYLFDELFKINPDVFILVSGAGKITKDAGNWQDRNIGSNFQPAMFSSLSIL